MMSLSTTSSMHALVEFVASIKMNPECEKSHTLSNTGTYFPCKERVIPKTQGIVCDLCQSEKLKQVTQGPRLTLI